MNNNNKINENFDRIIKNQINITSYTQFYDLVKNNIDLYNNTQNYKLFDNYLKKEFENFSDPGKLQIVSILNDLNNKDNTPVFNDIINFYNKIIIKEVNSKFEELKKKIKKEYFFKFFIIN